MKTNLMLLLCFLTLFAGKSIEEKGYTVGDIVDNFELKSVSGEMISLDDYKNEKGIILVFDCNTCPVSKAYKERIKELHDKFADKGFPVLAVNSNDPGRQPGDSFDEMVKYAEKNKYQHTYVQDLQQEVARSFGATNTPHVFVLKKSGADFKVAYIGAIDNNSRDASAVTKTYVEDAVNALLKGNNPTPDKTKAIGCTIKWKEA
ncbi:thioredoxin family protein [Fulvivirga sediminis]|uniref:Thioredoxin family protein n=1 Tax=Fulvivirga sediminis TaxID=2803949 RepID=A0A937FA72_9BACT|nr:thioredoxin family protein [Fulvivirga sediminis]MBL3657832.1 thioredoxin family protein [Fulvivirga sediminis]